MINTLYFKNLIRRKILTPIVASILLVSCSGSDEIAGIGGTGIVVGVITAFGSVYVNGIRFETDSSNFEVDGNATATQNDLSIGMVVRIEGSINANGTTGTASSIVYDDEVQGPIEQDPVEVAGSNGNQRTFTIFGQIVIVDKTTTQFEGITFDSLQINEIVEVSGFRDSSSQINASYVERKELLIPDSSEVELKGTISDLSIVDQRFMIGSVVVFYNAQTEIETENSILADGLFVEVEGVYQADQSILADEIEAEDDLFEEEAEEVSLQGIVSDFVSISDFNLNGQQVNASGAEFSPVSAAESIGNGSSIEVEGDIVDGVLFADEVEVRGGEIKVQARISEINASGNSFELSFPNIVGSVTVITNGQTQFDDETGAVSSGFSIDDLLIDDVVRIDGVKSGEDVLASIIKRDDDDEIKIEAPVDGYVDSVSINILGINYGVNSGTDYDDFSSAANFFDNLNIGDVIELEDEDPVDGIADKVGIED